MKWYLHVLKNYANFKGRARRAEFWGFTLANIVLFMLVGLISTLFESFLDLGSILFRLFGFYILAILIPILSVTVRRLHDVNKSGWYILIRFIPFIGNIWLLILLATNGTEGINNYGQDPKATFNELDEIGISEA